MTDRSEPPVALTIAGSDSGSGAGIQADIKTMAALGVLATTAITAVTAQNTAAVQAVHDLPVTVIEAQIDAVLDDLPVAAVKTGMLGRPEVVELVGRRAAAGDLPRLVVDPVMVASTGRPFVTADSIEAYRRDLLPHALVVTPNLWEATLLAGDHTGRVDAGDHTGRVGGVDHTGRVGGVDEMARLARSIHRLGPQWVLVKGGHLPGVEHRAGHPAPDGAVDVLFDGLHLTVLDGPHVDTPNTHGTGCTLSSAITAHLARGAGVAAAVSAAKELVHRALVGAAGWRLGAGHGPLDHFVAGSRPPIGAG